VVHWTLGLGRSLPLWRLGPRDAPVAAAAVERERGVSVEIVEETGRLMAMEREWNDLLTHSDADCLFLTWE